MNNGDYPRAVWRLIIEDGPRDGATNMAVDMAIAQACADGQSPPTLRFYQWAPPCVSLGRTQSVTDIDLEACRARGYHVVRRPTGGRAILHTDELTYSVAGRSDEPRLAGGVMDAYLRLSEGLVAGLKRLGAPVSKAPGSARAGPEVSAACFEVPSAYEITVNGRKLMGSAQSRRRQWVLQHGTLPLYGDVTRLVDCLALPDPSRAEALRRALRMRATTLNEVLPQPVTFHQAAQVLAEGFARALNLEFQPEELNLYEEELVPRYVSLAVA